MLKAAEGELLKPKDHSKGSLLKPSLAQALQQVWLGERGTAGADKGQRLHCPHHGAEKPFQKPPRWLPVPHAHSSRSGLLLLLVGLCFRWGWVWLFNGSNRQLARSPAGTETGWGWGRETDLL